LLQIKISICPPKLKQNWYNFHRNAKCGSTTPEPFSRKYLKFNWKRSAIIAFDVVADTFKAQSTFVGEEKSHPSKVIRLSNRAKSVLVP
jgi:hypothetical protein